MIADKFVRELVGDIVNDSLSEYEVSGVFETFGGECTHEEIDRLTKLAKNHKCRAVLGVGGGKTLDTAKAVAHFAKLPVIIAPTIASTDAPTSALSVIYNELGAFDSYLFYPQNPNVVVMDTNIIARAPARLLVAGMGDALATTLKPARAAQPEKPPWQAAAPHWRHWHWRISALILCSATASKPNWRWKPESAPKRWKTSLKPTPCSAGWALKVPVLRQHAIHNGFTALEECHHMYHGEKWHSAPSCS